MSEPKILADFLRTVPLFRDGPTGDNLWQANEAPELWDLMLHPRDVCISQHAANQLLIRVSDILPWLRSVSSCKQPGPIPTSNEQS